MAGVDPKRRTVKGMVWRKMTSGGNQVVRTMRIFKSRAD